MNRNNWKGQQVLILGAARQGLALAAYLSNQGATVILNDQRSVEEMTPIKKTLESNNLEWVLGGHPLHLLEKTDLVCPSGGVPLSLPILVEALKRGIPFSNDSQIFLENVNCKVIGITGSAGKTTTTGLVGSIAQLGIPSPTKTWVGGNIGLPLINHLEDIREHDLVVLELSSFQLEIMQSSPDIAAILNITPNHLDRHISMQEYIDAKANILRYQQPGNSAILNRDDQNSWGLKSLIKGNLISFSSRALPGSDTGITIENDTVYLSDRKSKIDLVSRTNIHLRGFHNLLNVAAACAITYSAGIPLDAMREGVMAYRGAPHRLELVETINGVKWYNDSIATAPERTIAAIQSFDEPIVLMVGGKDKNLPWEDLIDLINHRVSHLIVFGDLADIVMSFYPGNRTGSFPETIDRCENLMQAVNAAASRSEKGDVVLLAPGGTSFDEFKDFEERGNQFKEWVHKLT